MESIRIHSLDSLGLLSREGASRLCEILDREQEEKQVVVVSPVQADGFEIYSLLESARNHDERLWANLEKRSQRWIDLLDDILDRKSAGPVMLRIKQGFNDIEDLLKAIWLTGYVSSGSVAFTDKLTTAWVCDMLCHFQILRNEREADLVHIDEISIKTRLHQVEFVFGVKKGEDTEERAARLASELHADGVTFWNPHSLLYSADINEVPSASVIRALSYQEATELSFFGAPVIHPHALLPAIQANIDVMLRCWTDPAEPGTVVSSRETTTKDRVKGFSIIQHIALINVVGAGMSGVKLTASRLFTALGNAGISVILISQASSEYSICFAVDESDASLARRTAKEVFARELAGGQIYGVESEGGCAVLAAVGQGMSGQIGTAGIFFSSLAKAHVNIRAIAQGSSESNISAVIKTGDARRALRALHAGFFLSRQALSIGLIGPGNIGGTLLDQISREGERLKEQFGLDLRIRGICNSHMMLLDEQGIDLSGWRERFAQDSEPLDMERFLSHVAATYFPHAVLVDCTTSTDIAMRYVEFMERGMHIVTPNKKAGTSPYPYYQKIFDTSQKTGHRFLYETTVGAALPVINTLVDLVQTGDRIHKIEGIVSGTLAWLFNNYDGNVPFSSLVVKAKEMGYTEPDPRDDLSGMDVARKTVILARELGWHSEVTQMPIESMVPEDLRGVGRDEFMRRLSELDAPLKKRFDEARAKGEVLRYVGLVDEKGGCTASLRSYPQSHPFAQATGTDNVILFHTDRYDIQPLVIKGPGAGRDVTAGGVFSDILRLGSYLGARIM